ncbi:hypothetical protein HanRHA438_Chr00c43g0857201 [Helianthus annuus]|nr:hypothetical protein HanRHA438_Chr00c43g0857201 [Helianthus annuus]
MRFTVLVNFTSEFDRKTGESKSEVGLRPGGIVKTDDCLSTSAGLGGGLMMSVFNLGAL